MRDIVLVLSDQHNGNLLNIDNSSVVLTPNLQDFSRNATLFENAYTNCPLCVPARMSFLSGKRPENLCVLDNDTILLSSEETLATKLNNNGYRTVLVGRMHFKGKDQFHGFQERYVGDITTQWWGQGRNDLGAFDGTMKMKGCLKEFGYGISPVQEYDDAVCKKAIEILKEKDKRPLFLVIGFYGPHFPYCVEPKYYNNYINKDLNLCDYNLELLKPYEGLQQYCSLDDLQIIRSAYLGLIERLDKNFGKIIEIINQERKEANVIYTSDHGDQVGKRKCFGKKTLYQDSIKIPMIVRDHLHVGKLENEVSLLDLSKTILEMASINDDSWGGENIYKKQTSVHVISLLDQKESEEIVEAIIHQGWKYVKSNEESWLYYLPDDKDETIDLSNKRMDMVIKLQEKSLKNRDEVLKDYQKMKQQVKEYKTWTNENQPEDWIRFKISPNSTIKPRRL